jgi:hypothetical protein
MAAGALTVHELRYALAPQPETAGAHGYLPVAGLATALALAVAFARLAVLAGRAGRTGREGPGGLGFAPAWLLSSVSLVVIFGVQELVEGTLATGRAPGLATVFGGGGWAAAPLAAAVGALVALALVAARAVVLAAARRAPRHRMRRLPASRRPKLARVHRPRCAVLAGHLAGRGPPLPA